MLRWAALLGSVAVGILSPVIQPYFPHHPFVPGIVNLCGLIPAGVICGLLFTYFAIWGKKRAKRSLSRNEWNDFTLTRKTKISPNTAIYRFALPSESHVLVSLPAIPKSLVRVFQLGSTYPLALALVESR